MENREDRDEFNLVERKSKNKDTKIDVLPN